MTANSRTKNSSRNLFFSLINFMVKLILNFTTRTVLIRYLSIEYLGINGLFSNILSVLSLAELGIGNAIVYSMYKPVADNDVEKIKSLTVLYKKIYFTIAIVILAVGLALLPLLPHLIADKPTVDVNLYAVFVVLLLNSVIGYFAAYKRSLIFAYQRNDIEAKVNSVSLITLNVIQILILIFARNYMAYIIAMPVLTFLEAVTIFLISSKMFGWARGKAAKLDKRDTNKIVKNTTAMVCHKLGTVVVNSTDNIFVSAFLGLTAVGLFSNYSLITTSLTSMLGFILVALKGSIGNMIASSNKENVYDIFNALTLVFMWFVGFCFVSLTVLFQDFMQIWLGAEYKLDNITMLMICVSFYFSQSRSLTDIFKECAGLFWNDKFKPLFQAVINIGLNFLLVRFWGMTGIIVATIISTVATCTWIEPYVLFKNYFQKGLAKYYIRYTIFTVIIFAVTAGTYALCALITFTGIAALAIKLAVCLILPNLIFFLFAFKTKEFKTFMGKAMGFLKKKNNATALEKEGVSNIAGNSAENEIVESGTSDNHENDVNQSCQKPEEENNGTHSGDNDNAEDE